MYDQSTSSEASDNNSDNTPKINKHEITRTPLPASSKVYVASETMPDVKVPMRQIDLTDGTNVTVYDCSGPYTDPAAKIDIHHGLEDVRSKWVEARGDTETYQGRDIQPIDNGYKGGSLVDESKLSGL